jgi:hypothetical protein
MKYKDNNVKYRVEKKVEKKESSPNILEKTLLVVKGLLNNFKRFI